MEVEFKRTENQAMLLKTFKVVETMEVRFGISRHRFMELRLYLRCTSRVVQEDAQVIIENGMEQDKDPWHPICPFIAAFNECRKSVITPGPVLVVDEVMSMWYGLEQKYSTAQGMPHVTKMGMIKSASRRYPKLYLQQLYNSGWNPNYMKIYMQLHFFRFNRYNSR